LTKLLVPQLRAADDKQGDASWSAVRRHVRTISISVVRLRPRAILKGEKYDGVNVYAYINAVKCS
jgi:hypothetical protein